MSRSAASRANRRGDPPPDPEPLPADHPLWSLPGALVVPHVGGASSAMHPRAVRLIRTQIERLHAGEEPLNVVIPAS